MAQKKTKGSSSAAVAGIGAALAAAAAGAYWFYGSKDASAHRKGARSWMLKARAEILEGVETAVEKAGNIDKETYFAIADRVLKQYAGIAGVTTAQMQQMTKDLKTTWQHMQSVRKSGGNRATKKRIVSTAKKAVKVVKTKSKSKKGKK